MLIAHDMRSIHNVGSLLRTAEGLGVDIVFLTGYTPHPSYPGDPRLPYIAERQTKQINKTALDATDSLNWQYIEDIQSVINQVKQDGYLVAGLEQSAHSVLLPTYHVPHKVALILGREVEGLAPELQKLCDTLLEIPMHGKKESFNVVQAAAMALYHCRCMTIL